jgi:pimeloyl-ACP methyl ester carboxylesterase
VIEPLVLLPAMMCDARLWRQQAEALCHDRAVMIAPTHLGATVGEVAAQVLDAAPRRFALAGLGLGGVVAMEVLRRAPERVTRIALMATEALAETPQSAAAREEGIIAAKSGRLADVVRAMPAYAALAPGPRRPEVQALVQDMARSLGPEVFVRQSRLMQRRPDQQRALRQLRAPALILAGAQDTAFPLKRHEFLAELIASAELEVIEEAGHLAPLEAPEAVTEALDRWLRTPFRLT